MTPKSINIVYWITTGLLALLMFGSAIPDVMVSEMAVKGMHDGLGYPLYFIPFLGVAKILGVIAILIPGYPRLKEWAYAGFSFDLIAAMYSHFSSNQPWAVIFIFMALFAAAYYFYHKRLALK